MTNLENRLSDAYNKMTIEEKYQLLNQMEVKNLGTNDKVDIDFMESLLNIVLEGTTWMAKLFKII